MTNFPQKSKNPIFGPFWALFAHYRVNEFFPKNPALSLFYVYGPLTSCKKLEKTNEPILRTLHHGQTDGQMDRRTDDTEFIGPSRCKRGSKKEGKIPPK